jgi:hypothetical protein
MIDATAKGLGGGEQLHVHLESNDGLVFGQNFRNESSGGHIGILAREGAFDALVPQPNGLRSRQYSDKQFEDRKCQSLTIKR